MTSDAVTWCERYATDAERDGVDDRVDYRAASLDWANRLLWLVNGERWEREINKESTCSAT